MGCQIENQRYILKSMNSIHTVCQLNVAQAFGKNPMAAVTAVFSWWFDYGFYFSQNPGRP
jgi:hypothetical protein